MFVRTRSVLAVVAALVLGGGGLPVVAAPVQERPARTIEEALATDLGLTMSEFAQAGASAEQAAATLGLDQGAVPDDAPTVGRLTSRGVEVLDVDEKTADTFADLEQLRERYLAEVGPDGLTGLAYTLDGYEVLVIDPGVARERGRTEGSAPLLSPADWAAAHPGVTAVGTTGPTAGASLHGGAPISFGSVACTHGFNGWDGGAQVGISAGHCAYAGGAAVYAGSTRMGTVSWWQFGAPGSAWESYGTDLTTYSQGSAFTYPPSVATGSGSVTITGRAPAVLGLPVCKMGRQTGWTCSTVNKVGWQWIGDGSGDINRPKRWVWSLFADLRVIPGDSGGPWISGHKAVGVTSSYDWYSDGRPYSTAALLTSFDEYRPGAQVKVWLGTPSASGVEKTTASSGRARWVEGERVSGTLSQPSGDAISPGTVVDVFVDGSRVTSASVSGPGTFSFTYPGSDSTTHTVVLTPRQGDSRGTSLTVSDESAGTYPYIDFSAPYQIGRGWPADRTISAGDWDGNGFSDLMLVASDGRLLLYPATARERFASPRQIGKGWLVAESVQGGVDWDRDGALDLVARFTDGRLMLYRGNGTGGFASARQIGKGWLQMRTWTPVQQSVNGYPAVVATDAAGTMHVYPTNGTGDFRARTTLGGGWAPMEQVVGAGDWDKNGRSDLLVVDDEARLRLYAASASGTSFPMSLIGKGWSVFPRIFATQHDARAQTIWAVRTDGALYAYPATYGGPNNAFTPWPPTTAP
ncbi:VCBS repeat-containing protein [Ornithinimicrobium kibberense]|uniref:VCBS repeat protein n=1 Tax=Ornithinimicrobium kibberense TaxID=282060 RepID=A0ABV5V597_9MICO|nr:VCBS repeat-containing protein [Ornithinimicrobium kibberense]